VTPLRQNIVPIGCSITIRGPRAADAAGAESFGWDQAVAAGLIAVCPITELEFFYSARSARGREDTHPSLRAAFGRVPVHDGAYARAWEVQGELTAVGQNRSAGPVDLVIAATAELFGLTLLHHDRDFATIAGVTGQALRWYGPD
jgi:predicted nucleic acid-binding protein